MRLQELNDFWAEVSRTVRHGDFAAYKASYHDDAVLVSATAHSSYPISQAFERWKQGFADTKAGKIKATVDFRFSERLGDESTAYETGIFLYSSEDASGRVEKSYINFEALLVKKTSWKIIMEYQKYEASGKEWEQLQQGD